MINATVVGSPGWWLVELSKKLQDRRNHYQMLDDYYCGTPPLPQLSDKSVRGAFQKLLQLSRMNYAELAVEAVRERMNPNGFNLNKGKDKSGSNKAWDIWTLNHLDADCLLVHRNQLTMGKAFVIVGKKDDQPLITCEDPREVIVAVNPVDRREVIAALKMFRDVNFNQNVAYLYLPGITYVATSNSNQERDYMTIDGSWSFVDQVETGIDKVPVVEFTNNPNSFGKGYGEYEKHLDLLRRINYTIFERLQISTLQAFKQRAIMGVPDVDAEGNEVNYNEIFESSPDALWVLPPGANIWESTQTDLNGIRLSVKDDVQDFAAVTRTPLFYLTPEANNGSAEGASLAREGLIFKTKDRIKQTGECWEQVSSLSFLMIGDTKRANVPKEVLWDDPERFTLSERFDAATKALSAQVPWRTVMSTVLQYTPAQIDQMEAERAQDALQAASLATPQPPAAPPAGGAPAATQAPLAEGGQ